MRMLGLISALYQLSTSTLRLILLGLIKECSMGLMISFSTTTSGSWRKLTLSEPELVVSVMLIQDTEQSPEEHSPVRPES